MSNSPFLEAFDQEPRRVMAPTLAMELRETIARWFAARVTPEIQSSAQILSALADLAAEQIVANPTDHAQVRVTQRFMQEIFRGCRATNRLHLSGLAVTTTTKQ